MKSILEYIYESINETLSFSDFMDKVTAYFIDKDNWKLDESSDDIDDIDNMNASEIMIIQDEKRITYNFKTNDNNRSAESLIQIVGFFDEHNKVTDNKFAVNTEYLGNKTINEYFNIHKVLSNQLNDDNWNKIFGNDLFVFVCTASNVVSLTSFIEGLWQKQIDVSE